MARSTRPDFMMKGRLKKARALWVEVASFHCQPVRAPQPFSSDFSLEPPLVLQPSMLYTSNT
jgi:hypothetical protein